MADFSSWLSLQLSQEWNADVDVFAPYIIGILEDEEDEGEAHLAEALDDLLQGLSEDAAKTADFRRRIIAQWGKQKGAGDDEVDGAAGGQAEAEGAAAAMGKLDLSARLAQITETQAQAYVAGKEAKSAALRKGAGKNQALLPEVDESVKAAIRAQYAAGVEESEGESGDEDEGDEGLGGGNANAEAVAKAEQEKREQCRQAAMAKKEKDKEDREKQKQQEEDRKKKAQDKASKGERRR